MTGSSHTHTHMHRERESTTFSYIREEEAIIVTLDKGLLPLILALLFRKKEATRYFRRNKACDDKRADDTHQREAK